jgi:hypothetical protein
MRRRLSLLALSLFCAAMLAGALVYPGGSWLYPHSSGFSWTTNFWCDLTRRPAHNGAPNPWAPLLGTLGFAALGVALALFWMDIAALLTAARARFVRVAGVASAGATAVVALVPSDRFPALHAPIALAAGGLGIICGVLCGAFALRERRRFPGFAAWSLLLLVAAVANLLLYVRAVYLHAAETPLLPLSQKAATVALVAWVVAGLRVSARRPKP